MTELRNSLLADVLNGRRRIVWRSPCGDWTEQPARPPVGLLSGSFNPLHAGHRELRAVAERHLGGPVGYELAIVNADKPPLEPKIVHKRVAQFDDVPAAITAAPTFAEKAMLIGNVTFIVGYDTAERILNPRFYNDDESAMHDAIRIVQSTGCRFLVAGRIVGMQFCDVTALTIPAPFRDLFLGLSEDEFRSDISSTELRDQ